MYAMQLHTFYASNVCEDSLLRSELLLTIELF